MASYSFLKKEIVGWFYCFYVDIDINDRLLL